MDNIFLIIILGSIVSLIGTMLGALMGIMIKDVSKMILGTLIGFAGGLMLSVVMFDLIPESLNNWNFLGTLIFCIAGIAVMAVIDLVLNSRHDFTQNSHTKLAFITALGLMIHNLPEGIIMGCGFIGGQSLGIKMSIIISIHDIPEGIAVSAPLKASNINTSKILLYSFLTALPTAIGVWIGIYIGSVSASALGASLSFASGVMLYVVCGEMLPESSRLWEGAFSTFGTLLGILTGLIMTNIF